MGETMKLSEKLKANKDPNEGMDFWLNEATIWKKACELLLSDMTLQKNFQKHNLLEEKTALNSWYTRAKQVMER
jgi:hypothetical protein